VEDLADGLAFAAILDTVDPSLVQIEDLELSRVNSAED